MPGRVLVRRHDGDGQLRRRVYSGEPDRHRWLIELMKGVEDIRRGVGHGIKRGIWHSFRYLIAGEESALSMSCLGPARPLRTLSWASEAPATRTLAPRTSTRWPRWLRRRFVPACLGSPYRQHGCTLQSMGVRSRHVRRKRWLIRIAKGMARGGYGVFRWRRYGMGGCDGEFHEDLDRTREAQRRPGCPSSTFCSRSTRPTQWRGAGRGRGGEPQERHG